MGGCRCFWGWRRRGRSCLRSVSSWISIITIVITRELMDLADLSYGAIHVDSSYGLISFRLTNTAILS